MFVWIYILSKDAGSGLMYLVIYVGMAVAAGLAWYWFALGFGVLGLGIGGLVLFDKLPQYWMDRKKGRVRPMTGMTNRHMPIFSTTWKISMVPKPTQISASMLLLASRAVWKQR